MNKGFHVDPDGERPHRHCPRAAFDRAVHQEFGIRLGAEHLKTARHVSAGLQTDKIVIRQPMRQIGLTREGAHITQGGEGNMQEKPDLASKTKLAQFGRQREKMIVMDPDHIFRSGDLYHLLRKARINGAISPFKPTVELDQITAAVADRPKYGIGKTKVEVLVIFWAEAEAQSSVLALVAIFRQVFGWIICRLRVRSNPDAADLAQGFVKRKDQSTRRGGL